MKPCYYFETVTKESNSVKTIEMIMREARDFNAMIQANLCYLSEIQIESLKKDLKETIKILNTL